MNVVNRFLVYQERLSGSLFLNTSSARGVNNLNDKGGRNTLFIKLFLKSVKTDLYEMSVFYRIFTVGWLNGIYRKKIPSDGKCIVIIVYVLRPLTFGFI